jgi:predicted transcriptional regulator of viral defense system
VKADFDHLWLTLERDGRGAITSEQIRAESGASAESVRSATAYAIAKGRLFSPVRGLYVPVPAQYSSWRVVPAEHFIDAMMNHLGCHYYVGFLTAAAFWGSSHQAAQEYQVVVDRHVRDRDIERVRLRFHCVRNIALRHTVRVNGGQAMIEIATRDQCAVDLVSWPSWAGGLSNAATVLAELDGLDGQRLAEIASSQPVAVAQRLGWLIELLGVGIDVEPLRQVAAARSRPVLLDPQKERHGETDSSWGVVVNTRVEIDGRRQCTRWVREHGNLRRCETRVLPDETCSAHP